MTGRWEIEVTSKDPIGNIYPAQVIVCTDGTTRSNVVVHLDEIAPTSSLSITHFVRGGVTNPAEECMSSRLVVTVDGASGAIPGAPSRL